MNESQILDRLAAEDTFRADTQLPSTAWSHEAAFAEVERLIETVPEATPLRWQGRRRRVAFLAAAGAFVVVVLIGVAMALLAHGGDKAQPVATTMPSSSTTAVPLPTTAAPTEEPIDLETQQLLGSLERAYNRGDGAAMSQLVAPDAEIDLAPGVSVEASPSAGSLEQRAITGTVYGERIRFGDCSRFGIAIRCDVTFTDEFTDLSDLDPWLQTWTMELSAGRISRLAVAGEHPDRAAAMANLQAFVDERATGDVPPVVVAELEWNRTPEGHDTFDEYVVMYTALANGVPEAAYQLINDFHAALSAGDVDAAEALFAPGAQYRSTENEDATSAGVYGTGTVGSPEVSGYLDFWYRMLGTTWVQVGCSGDATTVTCNTESRGLMTLFLPGGVVQGAVTYTFGPEGIAEVLDRTNRAGGSCGPSGCGDDGFDLRGFWRSWMPENAPEAELLWPDGNGDPLGGFSQDLAAAIWEYYPQFLVENGIDVPPEYLDGSLVDALLEGLDEEAPTELGD